jgi:transcriptional regulator with XRE-family HTH domain
MESKPIAVRLLLSSNIKRHRELLGLSQEKLAEMAGISSNMVRDIEGCRTWVSDITITNLATALETDIYRLLMPETVGKEENYQTVLLDLTKTFQKVKGDIDLTFGNALKVWHLKIKNSKKS